MLLESATRRLAEAGCDMPRLDAEVLLAHTLGRDRTWLYAHLPEPLSQPDRASFERLLGRRAEREPVAYLAGHKEFFALDFRVNRHVLIPRPETELLVETAIRLVNENRGTTDVEPSAAFDKAKLTIADVGTGSGCIAVALARHLTGVAVVAIDCSLEALELARQNAAGHEVTARISFLSGHLLQPLTQAVDLIVSNPPYLGQTELADPALAPEVSRFEPRLALDGGPDGLDIIRQLLAQAQEKIKPGGSILVEIGAAQGQAVTRLARTHFPRAMIRIEKDLAGLDRLLLIRTT
jgi:release factor glutamine methyltransferase